MTTANDGGPAFPGAIDARSRDFAPPQAGMSLRDWFAGQALFAILKADDGISSLRHAREAYEIADAMLRARTVEGGEAK